MTTRRALASAPPRAGAIALATALALVVGCAPASRGPPRAQAAGLLPAPVGPTRDSPPHPPRAGGSPLTVRVYADEGLRRAVTGWQLRFFKTVERANPILRHDLALELEIVEMKAWPPSAGAATLDGALLALERADPGRDVDLVVGLMAPRPVATGSLHQLGMARILGRHLVLSGLDDGEEYRVINEAHPGLPAQDRDALYAARLEHKDLVVLLHELGHLLGAIHELDPASLMAPEYDPRQAILGARTRAAIEAVLQARSRGEDPRPALLAVHAAPDAPAVGYERERMLALLRGDPRALARATEREVGMDRPDTDGAGGAGDGRTGERRPPGQGSGGADPGRRDGSAANELERVADAEALRERGQAAAGWVILEPIARAHPDDPQIQAAACGVAMAAEPKGEAALEHCRRAARLSPADPRPALQLAFLLVQSPDAAGAARDALSDAERRLDAQRSPPEQWVLLAELYAQVHALSAAEATAARAGDQEKASEVRGWVAETRRRFGLDRPAAAASVPPEREPAYVGARIAIGEALGAGQIADAERRAAALSREFPGAPGAEADLCQAYAARRAFAKAEGLCRKAAAREPGTARPHVLLAQIAFARGALAAATTHLEEALRRDPADDAVRSMLAGVYRASGRPARAAQVERERLAERPAAPK